MVDLNYLSKSYDKCLLSNVLLTSDVSPKARGSALVIGYRQVVTDSGDCCGVVLVEECWRRSWDRIPLGAASSSPSF